MDPFEGIRRFGSLFPQYFTKAIFGCAIAVIGSVMTICTPEKRARQSTMIDDDVLSRMIVISFDRKIPGFSK